MEDSSTFFYFYNIQLYIAKVWQMIILEKHFYSNLHPTSYSEQNTNITENYRTSILKYFQNNTDLIPDSNMLSSHQKF